MTDQELRDAGYVYYSRETNIGNKCNVGLFEKCVRDEEGHKKYFIHIEKWDFSRFADPQHQDLKEPRYEANVQLTHKLTNETVNVELLSGWSIEQLEKFYEDLFGLGWFKNEY